jgi:DNA segregation ATPase FtsK/SpoIIIE-like protein
MEKILKELDDCTKKIANATEHLRMLAAKDSEQKFIAKYLQNGDDDIMYKALKIVLLEGHTSTSYLQRNLKISYNRAAELLETMEARKIVSKLYGNGTREVLIKRKTTRRRKYSWK